MWLDRFHAGDQHSTADEHAARKSALISGFADVEHADAAEFAAGGIPEPDSALAASLETR